MSQFFVTLTSEAALKAGGVQVIWGIGRTTAEALADARLYTNPEEEFDVAPCSEALYRLVEKYGCDRGTLHGNANWGEVNGIYDLVLDEEQAGQVDDIVREVQAGFEGNLDLVEAWTVEQATGKLDAFKDAGEYIDSYVSEADVLLGAAASDDAAVRYVACQRIARVIRETVAQGELQPA